MVNHYDLFIESFKDFWKNKILIWPMIIFLLLFILTLFVIETISVLLFVMFGIPTQALDFFDVNFILLIIFLVIIYGIAFYLLFMFSQAMIAGMVYQFIKNKTISRKDAILNGKKYFKVFASVYLIVVVSYLLPLIIFAGITTISFLFSISIGLFIGLLSLIIYNYYILYLKLGLIYLTPLMVDKFDNKLSAFDYIKKSFSYSYSNLRKVLSTGGSIILANTGFQFSLGLILAVVLMPLVLVGQFSDVILVIKDLIEMLVKFFIASVFGITVMIFLFKVLYTKKIEYGTNKYSGFFIRLLAFYIDSLLLTPIFIFFMGLFGILVYESRIWENIDVSSIANFIATIGPLVALGLLFIAVYSIIIIIYYVYPVSKYGGTPGKLLVGIRIVDENGKKISGLRAFARYLCYFISKVVIFLGFIWILIDDRRRGWHDIICGTYVVYDEFDIKTDKDLKLQNSSKK